MLGEAFAATIIDRVEISGNRRVPAVRIEQYTLKAGDEFDPAKLNASIRQLHQTGFFSEITVDAEVRNNQFVLTYLVSEMPLIATIEFNGNRKLTRDKLAEVLTMRVGDTMSLVKIGDSLKNIQDLYERDRFFSVIIDYKIVYRNEVSVSLVFDIVEGSKSRVYNIWFYGNKAFVNDELKGAIQTKEKKFWSMFNKSGTLIRDMTEYDRELLANFYRSHGYLDVEIGEADIAFQEDTSRLNYILRIDEGKQYTLRSLKINDPLGFYAEEQLKARVGIKEGEYFNLTQYHQDIRLLTDAYMEIGYAEANIEPDLQVDPVRLEVSVSFNAQPGNIFYINKINFRGNDHSRDNVLRREFDIVEGDQYNLKLLREAQNNLYTTGFFESATFSEKRVPGTDDLLDVTMSVKESKHGEIAFSLAYTTEDNEFAARLHFSEKNVFGTGNTAAFSGQLSTKRSDYRIIYSDPWIRDKPYSYDIEIFSNRREFEEYKRDAYGVSLTFGHQPIKRRLFLNYGISHERIKMFDIEDPASNYIKNQEGRAIINSFIPSIRYSHLNNNIDPSKGLRSTLSAKYAGTFLGGDHDFLRLQWDTTYYHPLASKVVGMIHFRTAQLWKLGDNDLPVEERFELGGMYTVRGFDYREITSFDEDGKSYGGNKMYFGNIEFVRPVFEGNMTIRGVIFFDFGQVAKEGESIFDESPRLGAGAGLRFVTAMGLIRLEYGMKLDKKDGESPSVWEFAIGSAF